MLSAFELDRRLLDSNPATGKVATNAFRNIRMTLQPTGMAAYPGAMGYPRYIPRDFCDQPKAFGKSPDLQFGPLDIDLSDGPITDAEWRRRLDEVAFARNAQVHNE